MSDMEIESLFPPERYKNESGKVITKGLFYELTYDKPVHHVFTLKDDDINSGNRMLYSLKKLYLNLVPDDPTEYTFAKAVFGEWEIWETIKNSPLLKPYVTKWTNEAHVKIKSGAVKAIIEEAKGGRNAYQAAKLLLERGWIERETATAVKERARKEQEKQMDDEAFESIKGDAERLGLLTEEAN